MMSGMRNAPPISISSPRETIASRPLRQRVEHEQHRGGVVVDDGRVLGAGQLAQQAAQMIVALAALAAAEIELERDRVAHRRDRGLDRLLGDQRAAEIGVQHGAGEIEHRPQARLRARFKPRQRARDGVGRRKGRAFGPGLRDRHAHGVDRRGAAVAIDHVACRRRAHHLVDRGKLVQCGVGFRHRSCRFRMISSEDRFPFFRDHALIAEQERVASSMTPTAGAKSKHWQTAARSALGPLE